MIRAFFRHLITVIFGYLAAVLASGLILNIFIGLQELWSEDASFEGFIRDLPEALIGASAIVAAFTFPVFLAALILVETTPRRHFLWFAGLGSLAPFLIFLFIFGWDVLMEPLVLLFYSFCGGVSGLTYWAIAGRHAGCWRG